MKKKFYLVGMAALLSLGACQESSDDVTPAISGETKAVKFELDASSLIHDAATRAYTPTYNKNGFSIYAFKQVPGSDPAEYVYNKKVDVANMTYNSGTKKLVGTDNLEIGTYKFVHTYGTPQTNLTVPAWSSTALNADLRINYAGSGVISEVFLETDKTLASLPSYTLGMDDSANQTITGTLKRSVSRIDLMFVSATKEGDTFVEKAYEGTGSDIFGGKVLQNVQLQLTGVNNQMNFFGVNTTTTPVDVNIDLTNTAATNAAWNKITIGDADETLVGTEGYVAYDNIQPADIIDGSAHIFGTYLLPNNDASKNTGLVLKLTPTVGETRTITITNDANKIPLERNKVTLIKVYVLNDNNIFSTTVDFEVEIITVWEDANEVWGSIS